MSAFIDYIYSGKYKLWKDVKLAYHSSEGWVYRTSEIQPLSGSKMYLWNVIDLYVVDDTPLGVGNFHWYFYLYNFDKYGSTKYKYTTARAKGTALSRWNRFYDTNLEEKLGGARQLLG